MLSVQRPINNYLDREKPIRTIDPYRGANPFA